MDWIKTTKWFIVISLVVIFGYDLYVFFMDGSRATISEVIAEYAYEYPFIPFLAGFVCGHLFWQMRFKRTLKAGE